MVGCSCSIHCLCSAHVTIRSSPLPLLLSTFALQSILPPFNSNCKELYGLNVPHLVIPHDRRSCKGLGSGNKVIVSYKRSCSSGRLQLDPTEYKTWRFKIRNQGQNKKIMFETGISQNLEASTPTWQEVSL